MLIGCCTNMLPQTDSGTGYEYAGQLKEAGFDYVELPLVGFEGIRAYLTSCALPVYACNNFFPAGIQLVGPNVDAGRVRAFYTGALERAAKLGCR